MVYSTRVHSVYLALVLALPGQDSVAVLACVKQGAGISSSLRTGGEAAHTSARKLLCSASPSGLLLFPCVWGARGSLVSSPQGYRAVEQYFPLKMFIIMFPL